MRILINKTPYVWPTLVVLPDMLLNCQSNSRLLLKSLRQVKAN